MLNIQLCNTDTAMFDFFHCGTVDTPALIILNYMGHTNLRGLVIDWNREKGEKFHLDYYNYVYLWEKVVSHKTLAGDRD